MIAILSILCFVLFLAVCVLAGLLYHTAGELNDLATDVAERPFALEHVHNHDAAARRAAEDLHVVLPPGRTYHWTDGGKPIPDATGPDMSDPKGGAR